MLRETTMAGFIVKENVIANKDLVIELYGIEVFEACMVADENVTFLAILIKLKKI